MTAPSLLKKKNKWLQGIFIGIVANSIIIYFWLPLFFVLAPGESYRHMLGGPCSIFVAVATLIYGIALSRMTTKNNQYHKIKIIATILNLMPTFGLILIVLLLAIMGHIPAP